MHGTEVLIEEILDWRPTDYLTLRTTLPNGFVALSTFAFEDVPGGTGVRMLFTWGRNRKEREAMAGAKELVAELVERGQANLRAVLAEEMAARTAAAADAPAEPDAPASLDREIREPIRQYPDGHPAVSAARWRGARRTSRSRIVRTGAQTTASTSSTRISGPTSGAASKSWVVVTPNHAGATTTSRYTTTASTTSASPAKATIGAACGREPALARRTTRIVSGMVASWSRNRSITSGLPNRTTGGSNRLGSSGSPPDRMLSTPSSV